MRSPRRRRPTWRSDVAKLTFWRSTHVYGDGKHTWRKVETAVTYPDDAVVHWDNNQRCVVIKDKSGQVLAAFPGVSNFTTEKVTTEESITNGAEQ